MFAVTHQYEPLSTAVMRFRSLWIFDLSAYHGFWKTQVQERSPELAIDKYLWRALLKAYGLHLFSPTEALIPFARDFHAHRRHPISSKNTSDLFAHFRRLGLDKVGHLRRLPLADFQRRFGKAWTEFLRGVVDPEKASWVWEPHRPQEPILWSREFDEPSADALWILEAVTEGLRDLSQKTSDLKLQKIELQLQLSDPELVSLEFPHPLCLRNDLLWVKHLFEERLTRLCLDAAVWKISLKLFPSEAAQHSQLSLFENLSPDSLTSSHLAFKNICERLENQGFQIFRPTPKPSHIPEVSWAKQSPLLGCDQAQDLERGLFRPLIHMNPRPIPKPEGRLQFTERLSWFDEKGRQHQRDYYLARFPRQWAWVFQNEVQEWFQQGVVE